jgi:hypothetical protein
MAGALIKYEEITEICIGFRWGHLKEGDNLKYLDVDKSIILKFI